MYLRLKTNAHDCMNVEGGGEVGALGDISPKKSVPKETWGDKGWEGTPKN